MADHKLLTTRCVVPHCNSGLGIKKHIFPVNSELGSLWVEAIQHPVLAQLSYREIRARRYWVCFKHFSPKCISFAGHRTLSADAVPSLFLPLISENNIKQEQDSDTENQDVDTENQDVDTENQEVNTENQDAHTGDVFIGAADIPTAQSIESVITSTVSSEVPKFGDFHSTNLLGIFLEENIASFATSITKQVGIGSNLSKVKRRVIKNKDLTDVSMTPKGQRVFTETIKLQKELSRCKLILRRKMARNVLRKRCLIIYKYFQHLSSTQQAIVKMQLQNAFKVRRERRFSDDDENFALYIYKRSPIAYRFLTSLLMLPSISTMKRNLGRIDLDTGINNNIATLLKECAESFTNEKDKVIILMWNKTHLKSELHYESKKDNIIGFENLEDMRTSKFVNEILVFMIRGLWSNHKLPISCYFSNAQTKYADLVHIIEENLMMLQEAGFQVIATVCDAGTSNVKAYEHLRANYVIECRRKKVEPVPHEGVIEFNGVKLCLLHDFIHLFKSQRNLLRKYIVELDFREADEDESKPKKFVKWEHFETAFNMDINSGICDRYIPKITQTHVRRKKVKKVRHCAQLFSRSMAKWLQTCLLMKAIPINNGDLIMEKEAEHTAQFTLFQDELFDSLNARKSKLGAIEFKKPLQQVVTEDSPHWQFWKSAIDKLENMRFRTETKKNPPKANNTRLRLIKHLKTMPQLWKILKEKKFPYFKIGYINQDPLENFFGRLKAYSVRNVLPSLFQSEAQLKALLVLDMSEKKSIGTN